MKINSLITLLTGKGRTSRQVKAGAMVIKLFFFFVANLEDE